MNDDQDARHPIRVVAHRTGLTPATLRAWERRYGVVEPARSEGGQRLYSDADIDRLARLKELTEAGRPISMVAELSDEESRALVTEDREAEGPSEPTPLPRDQAVDEAFVRVEAMDGEALEAVLRRAAVRTGGIRFLEAVVAPLFHRVGEAWAAGNLGPAQEHLAIGVVERILLWLTDPGSPGVDAPVIVVATLPGERHGLGARLAAATASLAGWRVVDLGVDLPPEEVVRAARRRDAAAVAISVVHPDVASRAGAPLAVVRNGLPDRVRVVVGGSAVGDLVDDDVPAGVQRVHGLAEFQAVLARTAPASGVGAALL